MSRAVQEDLSDLSFQERAKVRFTNFKAWLYNGEDGTIMGERKPMQWGALILYYVAFYSVLAAFTSIFFALLEFMLPQRPAEQIRGICTSLPNTIDGCGNGPYFQAIDLNEIRKGGEVIHTDRILKYSVCEPAFTAIPRAMNIGGGEPKGGYATNAIRKGYTPLLDEIKRVTCVDEFDHPSNPDCRKTPTSNQQILPLVPKLDGSVYTPGQFEDLQKILEGYTKPAPIYTRDGYSTYMVFFRFSKVWNFQPYSNFTTTEGEAETIQNDIGISCSLSSNCQAGVKAKNYKGEDVSCSDSTKATISADGKVKMDMLSNVMSNFDGFPWRGGALNMNFGSLALTVKDDSNPLNFDITCNMGVEIKDGKSWVTTAPNPGKDASSYKISNFDKQAGARVYSRSKGSTATIPVTF